MMSEAAIYNTVFYTMIVLTDGSVDYMTIDTSRRSVYDYYEEDEIFSVYYLDDELEGLDDLVVV